MFWVDEEITTTIVANKRKSYQWQLLQVYKSTLWSSFMRARTVPSVFHFKALTNDTESRDTESLSSVFFSINTRTYLLGSLCMVARWLITWGRHDRWDSRPVWNGKMYVFHVSCIQCSMSHFSWISQLTRHSCQDSYLYRV